MTAGLVVGGRSCGPSVVVTGWRMRAVSRVRPVGRRVGVLLRRSGGMRATGAVGRRSSSRRVGLGRRRASAIGVQAVRVELERRHGHPAQGGGGVERRAQRARELVAQQQRREALDRVMSTARSSGSVDGRMVPSSTPASSIAASRRAGGRTAVPRPRCRRRACSRRSRCRRGSGPGRRATRGWSTRPPGRRGAPSRPQLRDQPVVAGVRNSAFEPK